MNNNIEQAIDYKEMLKRENIPKQLFTLKQCVEAVNFWSMIRIPEELVLKHLKEEIK